MAGPNRAALISKIHKVLKQHYKPVVLSGQRPLLEHMLFACCLENAHYDKAEKIYNSLSTSFFDWNEVRVSTVKELSEAMRELPDPAAAAANLKCILQNVFEATYSFDLETMKKQNIGVGIKRLEKMEGASPFVVAYATQHALGGHSIPLDRGALEILYIVGIASEAEKKAAAVSGLERAIPKNKGDEFGSLLHQFSADFIASPFSPAVKAMLLSINPEAKDRLPKRGQKKEPVPEPAPAGKADGKSGKGLTKHGIDKAVAERVAAEAARHAAKAAAKKDGGKDAAKDAKRPAGKPSPAEHAKKTGQVKKDVAAKHAAKSHRPQSTAATRSSASHSATKRLAKRKPR
ncbi:MAG TPA: hypothetical protein VGJ15_09380 [Pirellulales bacterium]|jgi:endonuclease-3